MKTAELDFSFPSELIATEPKRPSRILLASEDSPREISMTQLFEQMKSGDLLVLNDTRVLKRRVFAGKSEILFLSSNDGIEWDVLFPSKAYSVGAEIELPENRKMTLTAKGRPQKVKTDRPLDENYFQRVGELPLPPYIQKAREERHNLAKDEAWYQTAWAINPGSFAAPTASLHFSADDIQSLEPRGVCVGNITLHVGLGTFLPVTADDLDRHEMHSEYAEIHFGLWKQIQRTKASGGRVWALGTTVARTLESAAVGKLQPDGRGGFKGFTDLLIQPGYKWQVVDVLLTNFHQPKSTLLALVASFAGLEKVKACYAWAIERKFRLFSYGDLSVWTR